MLTGIAWDHRRCWGPLDASVAPYRQQTGLEVRWDRRSLFSFGEGDLGSYADKYDLVIYDHPFVGDISRHGWMLDLSPLLSAEQRAHFAGDEVGASWRSYAYDGGIWALPLDIAAQTAAWRQDLLERHDFAVPETLSAVRQLAERGKAKGVAVGWPAVPTDLMCTLVSVAASMGCNPGHDGGDFLERANAEAAVAELAALARLAHPASKGWNPIRCLDHMAANDDVVYVPYLFNYANYASGTAERKITFGRAPAVAVGQQAHTVLGGAGIGISARTKDPKAAFDYAIWLCSPRYQAGDYVKFGGQPGSRIAWTSDACNALTSDFFRSTLPVMDAAYLRPTHPGFVPFFHDATLRLASVVFEGAPVRPFIDWLNQSYDRMRPERTAR
jgi:multiple sugar transport system substrate-binding protein